MTRVGLQRHSKKKCVENKTLFSSGVGNCTFWWATYTVQSGGTALRRRYGDEERNQACVLPCFADSRVAVSTLPMQQIRQWKSAKESTGDRAEGYLVTVKFV
jgi:hypothetical protein